jgi:ABC-type phosphate transport system permease subunit
MTVTSLITWAGVNRSYITQDTQIMVQPPTAPQPFAIQEIVSKTTSGVDWRSVRGDTATLLIVILCLVVLVAWINVYSRRMR